MVDFAAVELLIVFDDSVLAEVVPFHVDASGNVLTVACRSGSLTEGGFQWFYSRTSAISIFQSTGEPMRGYAISSQSHKVSAAAVCVLPKLGSVFCSFAVIQVYTISLCLPYHLF